MSAYGNGGGNRMSSGLPAEQGITGALSSAPDISMASDLDRGLAMLDNGGSADYLPSNFNDYANQQSFQQYMPMEAAQPLQSQDDLNAVSGTLNGAGAGPLPTGWGTQAIPNGGSTLTEFTKRRNWSQRLLEEIRDFLHILTPDGRIVYVSPSAEQLTGYKVDELVGKFIVDFIHADDSAIFVREFNESIASGHSLRFFYRFRKRDETFVIFESHGHAHLTTEGVSFGSNNTAGFCRGFFMMARPYPTKNASLLDSFLEHKIENERLTRRINDLQREEREEDEAQRRMLDSGNGQTPSDTPESPSSGPTPDQIMLPPPPKPTISNIALTQKNLDEITSQQKQDSIKDKMARYEGATHVETIEMLTGLRYRDGERSQGISTGDTSPALIRGDAGIAISADKDGRGDKKKKLKVADEFVCTDCGTLDSPEWRKGPSGPKTLCNACGLRWAKKEKKRTVSTPTQGPTPPGQAGLGSVPPQGQSQSPGQQGSSMQNNGQMQNGGQGQGNGQA